MQIVCPSCNTAYRVPRNRIPSGKRGTATCKKCGHKLIIHGDDGVLLNTEPAAETPPAVVSNIGSEPQATSVSDGGSADAALVREFPELNEMDLDKYDLGSIFTKDKKGEYKGRKNKAALKILKAVQIPLDKMLEKGEKVTKILWGTAYYPLEIFFGNGYLTRLYNRYAMAATDRRLLFINVDYRLKKTTHYFFQLPFQNIKKIRRGLFGTSLTFYKIKGRRRHFSGVRSWFSKDFKEYVSGQIKIQPEGKPKEVQPEELCPACFAPLEKGLLRCTHCWAGFKSPRKALIKSLLLPGLGDFYLGHRFLGVLEMTGSAFVWLFAVTLLLTRIPSNMVISAVLLVWVNVSDGLFTYYMAKKGYMLDHKKEKGRSVLDAQRPFDTQTGFLPEGV